MGSLARVVTVPRQAGPRDEAWLQRDGAPLQCWALTGTTLLGRSAAADVVLEDALVSRVHARLERVGPVWTLIDDGLSRNGTRLNGRRLHARARLADRDRIRVGRTELTSAPRPGSSGRTSPWSARRSWATYGSPPPSRPSSTPWPGRV